MPHQVPPGQGLGQGLWPNDRSAYSLPGRAGRPGTKKKRPGKVPGLWCVFSFWLNQPNYFTARTATTTVSATTASWRRAPTRTALKTFLRRPSQKTLPGMSISVASTPTFWMRTTQPGSFVLQLKPCQLLPHDGTLRA